jgi:HK97 family phage major capsid protein
MALVQSREPEDPEAVQRRDNDEIRRYLLGGLQNLTREQKERYALRQMRAQGLRTHDGFTMGPHQMTPEVQAYYLQERAQTTGTDASGGYLVPEDWFNRLTIALKAFGGMRASRATVLRTSSGEQMHLPTVDDTSNEADILAENTEVDETDVVVSEKVLDSYLYHSDLVRVPIQLLQDSMFDIGGLLARLLGERLGRKTNGAYTTGSGTNQPNGVVTASALGKTGASNSAISYVEMIDLKYAVDAAYHMNAEWMFNTSSLMKAVKQLLDGQSRPIFQPDVQSGRVDRIDGDPFVPNTAMADIAAAAKVMLYGDFSYYFIRDVLGVQFVRSPNSCRSGS